MAEVKEREKLPEGWKRVKLWEVIKETFPGEWGEDPLGNKDIFPVFSTLAIDYNGRIDFGKALFRKLNRNKFKKLTLSKGTILIEKSGGSTDTPAGKVAIIKNDFKGTCSNFIQILKAKEDICDSLYLFYRLYYNFKNNLINKYQQRTTGIINFILNDYFNDCLNLPPLPEQRKVAEILETVDNAIEKTDRIIEKYKRIKQGLMQDLLTKGIDENGQIRSEKTHRFKDSPLGRIPEEWEVLELEKVGEIISGSTPDTHIPKYWNGEINWITPDDLSKTEEIFITSTMRKITKLGLLNCSAKIIPVNSVVISTRAPIGYIKVSSFDYATNQGCKSIVYNEKFNPIYLAYLLTTKVEEMINLSGGTTFQEITKSNLKQLLIPFSPLPEQHRIASILSQIDEAIEKEQRYKEKLERIKQGLMVDLLTGKVRVNHLIEGVENVSQT